LSAQVLLWRLPSGAVTDEETLQQKRRGYWLRRARLKAGLTLAAASEAAGLSAGSGSTVSRWEEGTREIKVIHLERLARAYDVTLDWLMRPEKTDDERLDEAIRSAAAAERADSAEAGDRDPRADDELGDSRRRLSA